MVVVGKDSSHVVIPEAIEARCTSATCLPRCGAVSAARPARLLARIAVHITPSSISEDAHRRRATRRPGCRPGDGTASRHGRAAGSDAFARSATLWAPALNAPRVSVRQSAADPD
ncbi:hypothetical protein CVO74_20350 [Xanthomonas prunicola]|uniref:Uncharacterized protein n=1 Tax=Xanthomonas prunicola TaxID=2053930 RepID=A0A2N3RFR9_9XANT|nr:hypothetical protein XpruCFBP8353_18965 [Xanthomonas prunicola]PKV15543.1 hypothetical protein XpruCFBP8354_19355 [Xanthomonas prunicola]PKV19384.1 hypothetical protein CVO74_20350 [Xanthomonas prunicola]